MTPLQALCLGIVQGLTEFLPVSSSGHLVIVQQLMQLQASGAFLLSFDVALHFGTLLAVVTVFYRDLARIITDTFRWLAGRCSRSGLTRQAEASPEPNVGVRWALLLLIGTLPAAAVGLTFRDFFERLFTEAGIAGALLLVTGAILWLTRYLPVGQKNFPKLGVGDALLVGLAQAVAILPGISRSGTTIAAGLFRGFERELAARFSFLLAIPAIAGGMLVPLASFREYAPGSFLPLFVGTLAAALSGFVAIHALLRVVRRGRLFLFAPYCWGVGAVALIWFS